MGDQGEEDANADGKQQPVAPRVGGICTHPGEQETRDEQVYQGGEGDPDQEGESIFAF